MPRFNQNFPSGQRPLVSLGASADSSLAVGPGQLFGPRGLCLLGEQGPLFVADTGHHRVLAWSAHPTSGAEADLCLGQVDFVSEARNGGGEVSASSMNAPVSVVPYRQGIAVADSWNHRVLLWPNQVPTSGEPATQVLGQTELSSGQSNRGRAAPDAGSMFWPCGLYADEELFCVADAGNRRVLIWRGSRSPVGRDPDLILGQTRPDCRDQWAGQGPGPVGMVWPHAISRWGDALAVADAGSNRVMIWRAWPEQHGQACDCVLGQMGPALAQHNRGHARPSAASLAMPYALVTLGDRLIVADTANSRLLGWNWRALADGAPATELHGQGSFDSAGDNRWAGMADDSLCWPYGLAAAGNTLLIADTGNNRVQQWALDAA